MKAIILKAIAAILSVAGAGLLWIGLISLLMASDVGLLQTLAVYVSHLSFIGWLLFGIGSILLYLTLTRFVISRLV
jgi:hypothetical protein